MRTQGVLALGMKRSCLTEVGQGRVIWRVREAEGVRSLFILYITWETSRRLGVLYECFHGFRAVLTREKYEITIIAKVESFIIHSTERLFLYIIFHQTSAH